ncbi:hypothetical protein Leucomu_03605 [Leucobacter muris]|uniref:Uncharacterized protein n=1 Tax=Leucobacter muris TaxID=1935379 RepID=A0ABX5QDM6_9MICO|nr:hypothetical protein [Leucobacter muris]QAB17128.1 hypothetical protein Leucomu_03605 [Leucobacter muris]
MRFLSTKHPELRFHVGDASVKFRAGIAEVTDPDLIEKLHRYEHLGIEPGDDVDPEPDLDDDPESDDPEGDDDPEDDPAIDPEGDDDPDLDAMDEAQLRAFAETEGIDLGKLQNLDKIRTRIAEALAAE